MTIKLIKINNHLVDCFIEDGWENWSRWFLHASGYLHKIGGEALPPHLKTPTIELIRKELAK